MMETNPAPLRESMSASDVRSLDIWQGIVKVDGHLQEVAGDVSDVSNPVTLLATARQPWILLRITVRRLLQG